MSKSHLIEKSYLFEHKASVKGTSATMQIKYAGIIRKHCGYNDPFRHEVDVIEEVNYNGMDIKEALQALDVMEPINEAAYKDLISNDSYPVEEEKAERYFEPSTVYCWQ